LRWNTRTFSSGFNIEFSVVSSTAVGTSLTGKVEDEDADTLPSRTIVNSPRDVRRCACCSLSMSTCLVQRSSTRVNRPTLVPGTNDRPALGVVGREICEGVMDLGGDDVTDVD
jgi:hypothetical protein